MRMIDRPTWRVRIDPEDGLPILWVYDSLDNVVEGFQPVFEEGGTWADLVSLEEW